MSWWDILKTTEFSYDPKVPKGRANRRLLIEQGIPKIQIGLNRWNEIKNKNNLTDEQVAQGMANTIQHEYTHLATTGEVYGEIHKLVDEMVKLFSQPNFNQTQLEPLIRKFIGVMFMDEWMARAGMPKQEIALLTFEKALTYYPKVWSNKILKFLEKEGIKNKIDDAPEFVKYVKSITLDEFNKLVNKYKQKLGI